MVSKSTKSYIKKITTLKTRLSESRAKQIFHGMFSKTEINEIERLLVSAVPTAISNKCAYSSWSSNTTHSVALPIDPKQSGSWGYYYRIKKPFAKKDANLKEISKMIQDKLDAMNLDNVKVVFYVRLVNVGYGYANTGTSPIATNVAVSLEGDVPPTINEIAYNKQQALIYRKDFIQDKADIDAQLAVLDKFLGPLDE